jgi:hypothetical protein
MSTRARIGYETVIGGVVASYHHWDGYPSALGWNLVKNYSNRSKLMQAVDYGDASYWGSKISPVGPKHTFKEPEDDVNVYFGRDRGEKDVSAKCYASWKDFEENWHLSGEEYAYVLRLDGTWTMLTSGDVFEDAEDEIVLARAKIIKQFRENQV